VISSTPIAVQLASETSDRRFGAPFEGAQHVLLALRRGSCACQLLRVGSRNPCAVRRARVMARCEQRGASRRAHVPHSVVRGAASEGRRELILVASGYGALLRPCRAAARSIIQPLG
jgi:hypothetical protein